MIADAYDAFLLDLDGVLFRGSAPIPGAAGAVGRLRSLGKSIAFVTNNSSRTPRDVAAHLATVGIAADPGEIETSALTTAQLLRDRGVATAFVVGEEGLRSAVTEAGLHLLDGEPPQAEVVVVGFDRNVDYAKLRTACVLVQHGAGLVASNADTSFPAEDGTSWPGAGALLAVVELTTGERAEVIGKPNAPIFRAALRRAGGGRPLVIGDRIDTDIDGANALGWDSMLVLTGISTSTEATANPPGPTYVADDLGALFGG
jgi:HAD superfamily hydrolase (TIGR01457 family)